MYEPFYPADWSRVDAVIERLAAEWRRESKLLVEAARDAIDHRLGLSASFIRRSRGQRARFERQRLLQGVQQ